MTTGANNNTMAQKLMRYVGVDIIEIARIERAIKRWGESFLRRIYTDSELELYRRKPSSLAARFAGKEATIKALGAGGSGVGWKEVEILSAPDGRPQVSLRGRARHRAGSMGLGRLAISLAHSRECAIAFVSGEAG